MQELIEIIKKRQEGDGVMPFMYSKSIIKLAESLLEKEKEVMVDFSYKCRNVMAADEFAISKWYDKTFNTEECYHKGKYTYNKETFKCYKCGLMVPNEYRFNTEER